MKQKKKKANPQQYIGLVFPFLIGVIGGIIMVECIARLGDLPWYTELLSFVLLALTMYIAMVFHLIVHEAGHLLFGLLTGYKFSSFRVFSFLWLKENGKLRVKRLNIVGTGGQCLMTPPAIQNGRFPLVLYNLGGVLVNLILGALFFIGFLICFDWAYASSIFLMFSLVGFMIAMMNGIPMRMGSVDNDGYNAISMTRTPEAAEAFWVQLKVVEENAKGVRLKDMPAEWFTFPSDEAMKNSMVAARGVFACNRWMDEQNFAEADRQMQHMLTIDSGMVDLHRSLLICDRIFVELIGECRQEVIEGMLSKAQKQFMKAMKRFPSVLRTEYALALLLEKDAAKAEAVKKQFEKIASSYPYPHEVDAEREFISLANEKAGKEVEK